MCFADAAVPLQRTMQMRRVWKACLPKKQWISTRSQAIIHNQTGPVATSLHILSLVLRGPNGSQQKVGPGGVPCSSSRVQGLQFKLGQFSQRSCCAELLCSEIKAMLLQVAQGAWCRVLGRLDRR